MKNLKNKLGGVLAALLEMLVGVLLLINPVGFTSGILFGAGILLLLLGVLSILRYFRTDARTAALEQDLFKGLLLLVLGYFCTARTNWLIATFPLLTMLYGVVILISGLGKIQWTVDCLRQGYGRWFLPALSAAVSVICGVIILAKPFSSTTVVWMFTGATIVVEALLDLIALLFGQTRTAPVVE